MYSFVLFSFDYDLCRCVFDFLFSFLLFCFLSVGCVWGPLGLLLDSILAGRWALKDLEVVFFIYYYFFLKLAFVFYLFIIIIIIIFDRYYYYLVIGDTSVIGYVLAGLGLFLSGQVWTLEILFWLGFVFVFVFFNLAFLYVYILVTGNINIRILLMCVINIRILLMCALRAHINFYF